MRVCNYYVGTTQKNKSNIVSISETRANTTLNEMYWDWKNKHHLNVIHINIPETYMLAQILYMFKKKKMGLQISPMHDLYLPGYSLGFNRILNE